jgi:hypothetical protein
VNLGIWERKLYNHLNPIRPDGRSSPQSVLPSMVIARTWGKTVQCGLSRIGVGYRVSEILANRIFRVMGNQLLHTKEKVFSAFLSSRAELTMEKNISRGKRGPFS